MVISIYEEPRGLMRKKCKQEKNVIRGGGKTDGGPVLLWPYKPSLIGVQVVILFYRVKRNGNSVRIF